MNGLLGGVPVTIQLDRGECYIVKADTSDHPSDPSLSGSKIHSTKPVSVISGLTCGYVPVGDQSCNELMDELIGKKWWGSHFFFQPMGNSDLGVELVLTSDRDFYAKLDNGFLTSTQGRIATIFSGTAEVRTFDLQGNPVQVEAHQLTRGSDFYDFFDFGNLVGDPTLVSVLDTQYYTDTLVWNTPLLPPENGQPFLHFVPIVVPTADLSRSTIDGTPLSLTGAAIFYHQWKCIQRHRSCNQSRRTYDHFSRSALCTGYRLQWRGFLFVHGRHDGSRTAAR